eukprot:CAMPEP_0182496992 /NCGR_PEP_ID=MMETSP1321-20130603/5556_1 /TAXON_ID=91990 /ORGANISM="Bolidomonas sp., Strain RCC1657" /LENGTH=249 /DNA_ID=CAMNT_0024700749 /DNA_START=285 /DNA_END=1034 /DNA_ORIENTATION=-
MTNQRYKISTDKALIYRVQLSQLSLRRSSVSSVSVLTKSQDLNSNSNSNSNSDSDSEEEPDFLAISLNRSKLRTTLISSYNMILNWFSSSSSSLPSSSQTHFSLALSDDFSPSFRLLSGSTDRLVYLGREGDISIIRLKRFSRLTELNVGGAYDPKVLSCGNQLYKWLPIDTKNDCVIAARVYPGNECMMTEIRAWIGTKGYRTTVSGELYYCDVDVDKKVCYVVVGEGSVVFGENQVLGFEMEEVEGV